MPPRNWRQKLPVSTQLRVDGLWVSRLSIKGTFVAAQPQIDESLAPGHAHFGEEGNVREAAALRRKIGILLAQSSIFSYYICTFPNCLLIPPRPKVPS